MNNFIDNLSLVTWTHNSLSDVFPIYFGSFDKYGPKLKNKYVFINELCENIPDDYLQLVNDERHTYATRFLSCLEYIEDEYVLLEQEDFILYDYTNTKEFTRAFNFLKESDFSGLKLVRSNLMPLDNEIDDKIYAMPFRIHSSLSFTLCTTIWKKSDLIKIYEDLNPRTYRDVESSGSFSASKTMRKLGLKSCFYFDKNSRKIGGHYDCLILPQIMSAIVGYRQKFPKWNSQYFSEISSLCNKYGVDPLDRGWTKID
jgi:hypothetical protein